MEHSVVPPGLSTSGLPDANGDPRCSEPSEDAPAASADADGGVDSQEVAALRSAIREKNTLALSFHFLDYVLRGQEVLFEQIHAGRELNRVILAMFIMSWGLISAYGLAMGMHNGLWQALSSGLKLPILFLMTAAICMPSLYVFNVLMGQKFRFQQTVALFGSAVGTTSILLGSFAPIVAFFTWTGSSYPFLKLMHVCVLGLCGACGVRHLQRGCRYVARRSGGSLEERLIRVWVILYAIVGMQLGWRLRPFLGAIEFPFEFLRPVEGNFYQAIVQSVIDLVR